MEYRNLADYISTRMRQAGHNATSLSEAAGFGRSYISAIINGQLNPSPERLRKIAEIFGDDPNIALSLAGYYRPPEDEPVIHRISSVASTLTPRKRRELLNFGQYLIGESHIISYVAKPPPGGPIEWINIGFPTGEEVDLDVPPASQNLTPNEIIQRIQDALSEE